MANGQETNVLNIRQSSSGADRNTLVLMRGYWEELRAGRDMPLRSEVDPREIAPILVNSFVLERVEEDDIRFRLSGMGLNDLLGMEVRGMPLHSFIDPLDRRTFNRDAQALFDAPEIQRYQLFSVVPGSPTVHAELLVLPLKDDEGRVCRAIGSLVSDDPTPSLPRRFRLRERSSTHVDMFGPADTTVANYQTCQTRSLAKARSAKAPHLRLVKG